MELINLNEEKECEYCEVEKKCEELPERMGYYIDPEAPIMFQELHEIINHLREGMLFLAFEMGSIKLDISVPATWLEVNRTYMKVINAENGEMSIIRADKITGFIYEPPKKEMPEEDEPEEDEE